MTTPREGDTTRDAILLAIDRQLDGDLAPEEARRLEADLAGRPDLAAERDRAARLRDALRSDRIRVAKGFERRVMAALPPRPAWAAGRRPWAFPAAAALALALAAVAFLLLGSASPAGGVAGAVVDFFVSAVLTGAGLLAASWRGVGMALGELLSGPGWIVFGIGVLALDLLLLQMLRRRRLAANERSTSGDD